MIQCDVTNIITTTYYKLVVSCLFRLKVRNFFHSKQVEISVYRVGRIDTI